MAGKRRIAEWSALHAAPHTTGAPRAAVVTLAVCAAAVGLFVAVLMVSQVIPIRLSMDVHTNKNAHKHSRLTVNIHTYTYVYIQKEFQDQL